MADQVNERVTAYLERIGYDGSLDLTYDTLAKLQECHLHTVPYENLDIIRGVPLSLEIDHLFEKIVVNRRGGYCFELNALFGWLLQEIGFPVTSFMARFWKDEPNPPPKRRHHVLRVEADGEYYLCDVGVGLPIPRWPLKMEEELEHRQEDELYKLAYDPYFGWVLCEFSSGEWRWLYSFTEEPQLPKDFIMATYWCENSPDSIFTREAMVAIRTKDGRNTLAGREFRIFTGQGVKTFSPTTDAEYRETLRKLFGIAL